MKNYIMLLSLVTTFFFTQCNPVDTTDAPEDDTISARDGELFPLPTVYLFVREKVILWH